ncbi:MAG: phenylalanine--tRNA ligase subunit beta [Bdellovibrionaceae bacterium]|nr:phenylalanine--tRNA ligase subunit beta [Pseudobdellovibrionaceae bacterium]
MKFSLKWLSDFIEVDSFFEDPSKLAVALTQSGLEVDAFEDQKAQFKNVVTAKIKSVKKHPQADRLTLCEVQTDKQTYSIVCGAKNHKQGDNVILAKVGAILPGDFKIKKSRIRGVDSEGMLLNRSELGFDSKDEGIWILPKNTEIGKSFSELESLDDVVFEITVPPNRSDCLSHKGLAREISALFSIPFSQKDFSFKRADDLSIQKTLSVEVENKQACPRYCACLIEGIKIKESPYWLKKRLKSLGLKSINNIVDITNFVLWDRGQPLHAFDRDKIENIRVALAKKEKFLALDESEMELTKEDLTIRDKKSVLALAGVMGGLDSSITNQSKNIIIESAFFTPEKIRKTSRRFGLETDSSYRFARGVDSFAVKSAMDFACYLIQKEAGGKISKDFYDLNYLDQTKSSIKIGLSDLSERLGYSVSAEQFKIWMKKLGCEVSSSNVSAQSIVSSLFKNKNFRENKNLSTYEFEVTPPSYRSDLKIKEDLIEEFARLEGYHKVPETLPMSLLPNDSDSEFLNSKKWIDFLSFRSWFQAVNYSFCDPDYYKEFLGKNLYLENTLHIKLDSQKQSFSIDNPISQNFSFMKTLLIPDIVKNISYNFRRNNKFGQIFELAPIFYQKADSYYQEFNLAMGLWGEASDIWRQKNIPNFYVIKSALESCFKVFGLKAYQWEIGQVDFLHPKQTLILKFQKQHIGFVGTLHPSFCNKYKIKSDVALAELNWSILNKAHKKELKFKSFSNLLTVEKDLCFVVPLKVPVNEVQQEIKKSLSGLCEKVEIFDIYTKKDQRFISFRIYLTPKDQSWTDKELQDFLNKAIQSVNKKFAIQLKSG